MKTNLSSKEKSTADNAGADTSFSFPKRISSLYVAVAAPPKIEMHEGIFVARDDLIPGGTKSRYVLKLFESVEHLVYPSYTWGGAQVALAHCARATGKKATLFVPERKGLSEKTLSAVEIGQCDLSEYKELEKGMRLHSGRYIDVVQVPMGFLNVLQSRARHYAEALCADYLEVGAKSAGAEEAIASTARQIESIHGPFNEVWSVAGSGTLSRGLQQGFISSKIFTVQAGMELETPGRAEIIKVKAKLDRQERKEAPFPSCAHYDRKAWFACLEAFKERGAKAEKILFWNVMG